MNWQTLIFETFVAFLAALNANVIGALISSFLGPIVNNLLIQFGLSAAS